MATTKLRLQLDSSALERLIGGDTEIELELRNGIANEFAKRHLRSIINDNGFKAFIGKEADEAKKETKRYIEEHISKRPALGKPEELNAKIKKHIDDYIANEAKIVIEQAVKEINKTIEDIAQARFQSLLPQLDSIIEIKVRNLTDTYIDQKVQQRLIEVAGKLISK